MFIVSSSTYILLLTSELEVLHFANNIKFNIKSLWNIKAICDNVMVVYLEVSFYKKKGNE
jgi:hypothetical protein